MMKSKICYLILLCVLIIKPVNADFSEKKSSIYHNLKKSVVYIEVFSREKSGDKYIFVKKAYGSGTILTKSGYLITNYHVVSHGDFIHVTLSNGKKCELKKLKNCIYLSDPDTDLAVIKLDSKNNNYTPVNLGDSQKTNEGDSVYAIGNPYGLIATMTGGIISSKSRNNIGFAQIEDFIQTDVPINPGNSGGPLINNNGEVIGINTAIRTISGGYQGISFAIPSNMVKFIFIELVKYGRVRRGWLGLLIQNTGFENPDNFEGVKVVSVIKNSPSHYAGIKSGDVITHINNKKVLSRGYFLKLVKNKIVGTKLVLTLKRKDKIKKVEIILREKKYHKNLENVFRKFYQIYGVNLEINYLTEQLVVTKVSPFKMYLHANDIQKGDFLCYLNGKEIKSPIDFVKIFKYYKYKVRSLQVIRNSQQFFIKINTK